MTGNEIKQMVEKLFRHYGKYTCISLAFGHHTNSQDQTFAAQIYIEGVGHLVEVKTAEGLKAQFEELLLENYTDVVNDDHLMD